MSNYLKEEDKVFTEVERLLDRLDNNLEDLGNRLCSNRLDFTKREDGYVISTIKLYFTCETGIWYEDDKECSDIRIVEVYKTEEEAKNGHKKYANMTTKELEKIEWIG